MSSTATATYTYSVTDVEAVMRRFSADIVMMATSSGAITEDKARTYAHDVEVLAKSGYLKSVDLTLLSGAVEVKALDYDVKTSSGDLEMSRPGGVLWPRVTKSGFPHRAQLYGCVPASAREQMKRRLKIGWVPTNADTSHTTLARAAGGTTPATGSACIARTTGREPKHESLIAKSRFQTTLSRPRRRRS